jgi:uncharacterized protein (TIGR00730 family)
MLKKIGVFCGSASGINPLYDQAAVLLGNALAEREITLVYGGAQVGLMGKVANAVLEAGGSVIGVIPQLFLEPSQKITQREIVHRGLTELHIVENMHERKAKMASLAEGFIALPGGFGTFDEIFEILTWAQLGIHEKPCGFLNVNNFYNPLMQFLDNTESEGFLASHHRTLPHFEEDIATLLKKMCNENGRVV